MPALGGHTTNNNLACHQQPCLIFDSGLDTSGLSDGDLWCSFHFKKKGQQQTSKAPAATLRRRRLHRRH